MVSPAYLLDTNICIYAMNGRPSVLRKFRQHGFERLSISALVAGELAFGVEKSQRHVENKKHLNAFLNAMNILPWDESAIWHFAVNRNRLRQAGTPIGEIDLLLASQALANNAIFVTNNVREFERIEGLQLENWVE